MCLVCGILFAATTEPFLYLGYEYWYHNGPLAWSAAENHCVTEFGGHLASFHSADEYNTVTSGLTAAHGAYPKGWIGLTDGGDGGTFEWSDGSSVVWTSNHHISPLYRAGTI